MQTEPSHSAHQPRPHGEPGRFQARGGSTADTELRLWAESAESVASMDVRVNGEDFHVNKDLFKLFRHEVPYRLYRAPHSRVLLAAEPTP